MIKPALTLYRERTWWVAILLVWNLPISCLADQSLDRVDFNRDVKPILAENCFHCHGQDDAHRMADLRLDQRESALESAAIVPGSADQSQLITRIFSPDPDLLMPPRSSHRTLNDYQKEILKRWVEQGANYDLHWAFAVPVRPDVPSFETVAGQTWVKNPIDAFVLARMSEIGLEPSPSADRRTLIKRLYTDLIGLPPTREEMLAFVDDPDPQAYEKLVDRLLASPHYGERMSLDWLDAARYADSNGFQQDGDTWQWIWRDWVVKALNDDMPFDQFSIWQLAGDLLENPTTEQLIATAFNRNHLLNGEGGGIAEEQRFVNLFDRMDTTSTNWLGMTIACAQCHNHKYDPVSQREYYQLLDMFNRVPEVGRPEEIAPIRFRLDTPFIEFPSDEQKQHVAELQRQLELVQRAGADALKLAFAAWELGLSTNAPPNLNLPDELKTILAKNECERSEGEKAALKAGLQKYFEQHIRPVLAETHPELKNLEALQKQLRDFQKAEIPRLMVMSDAQPRQTHVLSRGQYLEPLEPVSFATPEFLPPLPNHFPRSRLGFAQWLFLPEHPLTARVQVNRIWQHFFGSGLVKTSEDFGVQSDYPVHRELLDWLAVEFRENGWSRKKLQRLILTSAMYQQSSKTDSRRRELDPENRYYSRVSRFRMPAMILRDWALASSGLLQKQIGGAPVFPYQPDGVWESLAITKERDFTYPLSTGKDLFRRSLYTFWRRTISPANMFDASNRQSCRVRSSNSNTPLHALTTLNDPTWVEAARSLAESIFSVRVLNENSSTIDEDLSSSINNAFESVLCRKPSENELAILQQLYQRQLEFYRDDDQLTKALLGKMIPLPSAESHLVDNGGPSVSGKSKIEHAKIAALTNVCLAIFNLDEALTRE